jgi:tyrosine-specific transport protein
MIKKTVSLVFSIALLVSGNLIGAGILGIPISAGLDGFGPSILAMIVYGSAMFFTAYVISVEVCETKEVTFNYPSLYQKYLKDFGKWIAIATNMLILYGLLVAYITGGSQIISSLFGDKVPIVYIQIIFFVIVTILTLAGVEIVRKYNMLLMIFLWGAFAFLVFMGQYKVVPARLTYTDWYFLPAALPIILTSFHFHNIIPTISKRMNWHLKYICIAMITGMVIGFVMNALWLETGVGMLPLNEGKHSILYTYLNGLPITVQIFAIIKSKAFIAASFAFALLAIMTSYFANGIGLLDFSVDLTYSVFGKHNKILTILVTFLPPFLISIIYPSIFLKSINIVGGIGIVILFGILPCFIAFIKMKKLWQRVMTTIYLILFLFVLIFQVGSQTNLINLKPKALSNYNVNTK